MGALCILAGMIAAAQPPSLNKAIALYNDLSDAAATKELRALLKTDLPDPVAAKAHVYLGLIAFNEIHTKEARSQFKRALTLEPTIELPVGASPKARLAFSEARHELQVEMAKPVQPPMLPAPGPTPNPAPSPDLSVSPLPGENASPNPTPAPNPSPSPSAGPGPSAGPPPQTEVILIPPPPPPAPSDEPLVEDHVVPEPSPRRSHALSITLGSLGLVAGGIAIVGAVEVADYNSTLADAKRNPGKYTGAQISSKQNSAQIWQISAITLAVLAALGVTSAVLTW